MILSRAAPITPHPPRPSSYAVSVLLALGVAGTLALLAALARIGRRWPTQVPAAALLAGVAFLFGEFALVYPLGFALAGWYGLPVDAAGPAVGVMLGVLLDVMGLTIGGLLLIRGRLRQRGMAGTTGLFLIAVVLLVLIGNANLILATAGLTASNRPLHLSAGIRLLAALGVLGMILWLIARPRSERDPRPLLVAALLLLAGLQVIEWSYDLVAAQTALGALSPVAFAGVFLVAVLWDVLTSGDEITNGDSRAFPRDGRVLLYLGYTMVASALLLYAASVQVTVTGALGADALGTGDDATLGLLLLGIPMVGLGFILRCGRWLAARRSVEITHPSPARPSALASAQAVVLGTGLVVMLALVAVTALRVVPLALAGTGTVPGSAADSTPTAAGNPSSTYRAPVPGPGCDSGGARWTLVPPNTSTQCTSTGLDVTVLPNASVLLDFVPPGKTFPSNYRVSARIDLSGLSSGCAGIITRDSSQGFYEDGVCVDGEWAVFRDVGSAQQIGHGTTQAASTYLVAVEVRGAILTLTINGAAMPTISDATLTTTDSLDVSLNNFGATLAPAVVSDFTYTPLP